MEDWWHLLMRGCLKTGKGNLVRAAEQTHCRVYYPSQQKVQFAYKTKHINHNGSSSLTSEAARLLKALLVPRLTVALLD
jgi:hypothetical protein